MYDAIHWYHQGNCWLVSICKMCHGYRWNCLVHYLLMCSDLNSIEMINIMKELTAKSWTGCHFPKCMIKCMGMALHLNHSHEVIEILLHYYPAVFADPISDGMLPLHFACKWHQSEAVITKLFCAYPDVADKMDETQKTPIQHMMENNKPMARNIERIFCPLEPVHFCHNDTYTSWPECMWKPCSNKYCLRSHYVWLQPR